MEDKMGELLRCAKCNLEKPEREFNEDRSKRGFRYDCKECYTKFRNIKKFPIACIVCHIHKKTEENDICKECNFAGGMKTCNKCNELKLVTLFRYIPKRTGISSVRSSCHECELKAKREWDAKNPEKVKANNVKYAAEHPNYFKNKAKEYYLNHLEEVKEYELTRKPIKQQQINERKDLIRKLKESSACKDCDKKYPYYVMDFDHLKDKKINISTMVAKTYSIDAIMKEISKCDLVCSNCHKNRTYQRKEPRVSKPPSVQQIKNIVIQNKQKPCTDCDMQYDWWIMEYDHRNPTTKICNISGDLLKWFGKIPELLLEIAKCDVVCSNCHRIRTANQKGLLDKPLVTV